MSLEALAVRDARVAYMEGRAAAAVQLDGMRQERDAAQREADRYRKLHSSVTRAFAWALVLFALVVLAGIGVALYVAGVRR